MEDNEQKTRGVEAKRSEGTVASCELIHPAVEQLCFVIRTAQTFPGSPDGLQGHTTPACPPACSSPVTVAESCCIASCRELVSAVSPWRRQQHSLTCLTSICFLRLIAFYCSLPPGLSLSISLPLSLSPSLSFFHLVNTNRIQTLLPSGKSSVSVKAFFRRHTSPCSLSSAVELQYFETFTACGSF